MNDWIVETVASGTLLLAIPVAVAAGLLSFFSPCVVPLLPGYLSYVTGVGVQDLDSARRGRMLLGSVLFVLGFTAVFVAGGALFGFAGKELATEQRTIEVVAGILMIALGLAFAGAVPFLQRDLRVHAVPRVGLVAAPLLGVFFGVGWAPCIGPTLSAVFLLSASTDDATAARCAFLSLVYGLGLGIPFVLAALGFGRMVRAVAWVREHQRGVSIAGAALMAAVGLALVTGWWSDAVREMQGWIGGFEAPL